MEGLGQMKWKVGTTEYETVQQHLAVAQKNQFFAAAAGVVVHQHTRVLMADLHGCGDGMRAEDVRAGLQQLAAELTAAYKAARTSISHNRTSNSIYYNSIENTVHIWSNI